MKYIYCAIKMESLKKKRRVKKGVGGPSFALCLHGVMSEYCSLHLMTVLFAIFFSINRVGDG